MQAIRAFLAEAVNPFGKVPQLEQVAAVSLGPCAGRAFRLAASVLCWPLSKTSVGPGDVDHIADHDEQAAALPHKHRLAADAVHEAPRIQVGPEAPSPDTSAARVVSANARTESATALTL